MDGLLYYFSLAVIGIFIYIMTQHNSNGLALIALIIGIYIVYSHETGYTATDFRHDMVNTIDTNAVDYTNKTDIEEVKRSIQP